MQNYEMCEKAARTQAPVEDGRLARPPYCLTGEAPVPPLSGFLELSLERVFGAVAGLREIAIGAVLHGVGVSVAKLVGHGVVTGLATFVWFFGTLAAVGIIQKMVAGAFRHGSLSNCASITMNTGFRLRRKLRVGNVGLHVSLYVQVAEIAAIGKFNSRLRWS
jgi:hypothetical protein